MRDHVIINADSIPFLFKDQSKIDYMLLSGESIGDLSFLNIRINVVPYTIRDYSLILLQSIYDREWGEYGIIPSRVVTIPEYLQGEEVVRDLQTFDKMLINNAYMAICRPDDELILGDAFDIMDLDLLQLLKRKGLSMPVKGLSISFVAMYDPKKEFYKEFSDLHCVDIYALIPVEPEVIYSKEDGRFFYIGKNSFKQYYESSNQKVFAESIGIYDYDESSPDFRIDMDGQFRIAQAIKAQEIATGLRK